jgi:hypothetical protein
MKKIFLFCMLVPFLAIGQTKNVINTFRISAKPDKNAEFIKAFTAHAQKYHTGDWKWRVYEIQTGPDAGAFHVIEGPLTWEQFDKRGDLGTEHTADWDKNVSPLTTGMGTQAYSTFNEELSTVLLGDYSDKIILNHMFPKPGMIDNATELVKKLKKMWIASSESVAVYTSVASGAAQIISVNRLKGGLKELDLSFRKPMRERFNAANGDGSWKTYLEEYAKAVESRWSEMLFLRPDMGSK